MEWEMTFISDFEEKLNPFVQSIIISGANRG